MRTSRHHDSGRPARQAESGRQYVPAQPALLASVEEPRCFRRSRCPSASVRPQRNHLCLRFRRHVGTISWRPEASTQATTASALQEFCDAKKAVTNDSSSPVLVTLCCVHHASSPSQDLPPMAMLSRFSPDSLRRRCWVSNTHMTGSLTSWSIVKGRAGFICAYASLAKISGDTLQLYSSSLYASSLYLSS